MSTTTFHFESFEAFSPFNDVGPYRASDYWTLPEGEPVELIKGRLLYRRAHRLVIRSLLPC